MIFKARLRNNLCHWNIVHWLRHMRNLQLLFIIMRMYSKTSCKMSLRRPAIAVGIRQQTTAFSSHFSLINDNQQLFFSLSPVRGQTSSTLKRQLLLLLLWTRNLYSRATVPCTAGENITRQYKDTPSRFPSTFFYRDDQMNEDIKAETPLLIIINWISKFNKKKIPQCLASFSP